MRTRIGRTFNVIYADPPWTYQNKKTGGTHTSGASQKYDCLTLSELITLPIVSRFEDDAVCFLWVVTPMLDAGLMTLNSWGFRYVTSLYWHKVGRYGTGYWFRGEVEQLMFGVRGNVRAFRSSYRNHYAEKPSTIHSRKPAWFRTMIQIVCDARMRHPRYLELFATERVRGWYSRGLAIDGLDLREG